MSAVMVAVGAPTVEDNEKWPVTAAGGTAPGPATGPGAGRSYRWVRRVAVGVLLADVLALSGAAGVVVVHRVERPAGDVVVRSQCLDGHVDQSIKAGAPGGLLLAYDTGEVC